MIVYYQILAEIMENENWRNKKNEPDELWKKTEDNSNECGSIVASDSGMECEISDSNEDTWISSLVDSISTLDSKAILGHGLIPCNVNEQNIVGRKWHVPPHPLRWYPTFQVATVLDVYT